MKPRPLAALALCALVLCPGCFSWTSIELVNGDRYRSVAVGGKGSLTAPGGIDVRYDNEDSFRELNKTGRALGYMDGLKSVAGDVAGVFKAKNATRGLSDRARIAADSDLNLLNATNAGEIASAASAANP